MKSNLLYIADYKNEEFHEKLMSSLYDALENYSILTEEEKSNLDIDVEFFELDKVYTTPHLLNDDVLYIRVRFGRSDYIARYKNGILVIWIDDHITHVDFCFGERVQDGRVLARTIITLFGLNEKIEWITMA